MCLYMQETQERKGMWECTCRWTVHFTQASRNLVQLQCRVLKIDAMTTKCHLENLFLKHFGKKNFTLYFEKKNEEKVILQAGNEYAGKQKISQSLLRKWLGFRILISLKEKAKICSVMSPGSTLHLQTFWWYRFNMKNLICRIECSLRIGCL